MSRVTLLLFGSVCAAMARGRGGSEICPWRMGWRGEEVDLRGFSPRKSGTYPHKSIRPTGIPPEKFGVRTWSCIHSGFFSAPFRCLAFVFFPCRVFCKGWRGRDRMPPRIVCRLRARWDTTPISLVKAGAFSLGGGSCGARSYAQPRGHSRCS